MIIIGEKINGSIPVVADAIAKRDAEFIKNRAKMQAEAGATFIDCCASVPEAEEVETLKWMIDCIQEVTDLPISVDSPSADVLAQVFPYCKRPGLINSVSGEGDKIDKIFPLIADTKWEVICLLSDDTGIPKSAADRLRVFDKILKKRKNTGCPQPHAHRPAGRDALHFRGRHRPECGSDQHRAQEMPGYTYYGGGQQYFF